MKALAKETVSYMGMTIEFAVVRKPVKNINLRINHLGEISISAPKHVPAERICEFVRQRASWIVCKLSDIETHNKQKPDSSIYSGKNVYYMGKLFTIGIEKSGFGEIVENGDTLLIKTQSLENSDEIKKEYMQWLNERAKFVFEKRMEAVYKTVSGENIPRAELVVKNMKTLWGTCNTAKKRITLNLQLVKTSVNCIDKVILHEYMHFKQANHGPEFYKLMDKYMPDWRLYKKELKENYKDGI